MCIIVNISWIYLQYSTFVLRISTPKVDHSWGEVHGSRRGVAGFTFDSLLSLVLLQQTSRKLNLLNEKKERKKKKKKKREKKREEVRCHRLLEAKMYFYCVMFYFFVHSTSGKLSWSREVCQYCCPLFFNSHSLLRNGQNAGQTLPGGFTHYCEGEVGITIAVISGRTIVKRFAQTKYYQHLSLSNYLSIYLYIYCNRVHLHIVFVLLYVLWVCRSVGVLSCVYVIRSFTYVLRVVI